MNETPAIAEPRASSRLAVERLEKRYKARAVVHDVSLDVISGEVVGLLGPNGAGKTTCFYMIVGLIAADGGGIELDGRDLSRLPIHARARLGLSYLPQEACDLPQAHRRRQREGDPRTAGPRCRRSVQSPRRAARGPLDLHLRTPRADRSRAGSVAASRSRARSRRDPASSCSTNRSPASIRSPCSTSRRSSVSSSSAASAC